MEYVTVASQALLTAVFGWAAAAKLRSFATFQQSVRRLGLLLLINLRVLRSGSGCSTAAAGSPCTSWRG